MYNMDKGNKCIAWVGNLYQKLEAICVEADGIMRLEASTCLQETVQGVQKFFSAVMEDVLPSLPRGAVKDYEPVAGGDDGDVKDHDNSDIHVEEEPCEEEVLHSSLIDSVEDTHSGSFSEQASDSGMCRKLKASINGNEGHIKKEGIRWETGCTSSMETGASSCSASTSSSIPSIISETLIQLPDTGSTIDNSLAESTEASHDVVSKSEPKDIQSFDKVNLEESCVIVDGGLRHSLSSETETHSFYKSAFPTKEKIRERPFAKSHKNGNTDAGSNEQKSSQQSFFTVESESPEQESSNSDWEII